MIIKYKHFGPINEFEIDLSKNMTFIYGKNNIGKSYAITACYLILKNLINMPDRGYLYAISERVITRRMRYISEKTSQVNDVVINDEIGKIIINMLSYVFIEHLQESFVSSFTNIENISNSKTDNKFEIYLDFPLFSFTITEKDSLLTINDIKVKKRIILRGVKKHRYPRVDDKSSDIFLYYHKEENFKEDLKQFITTILEDMVSHIRNYVNNVYYLPASRSGLYQALSAFSQIVAEFAKKKSFLTNKMVLPSISEPLSDYFLRLSEIDSRLHSNEKMLELANLIEKELLNGVVRFDQRAKKMLYKPNGTNVLLEISAASSMVAEISPIVLYLRYIVNNIYTLTKRRRFGEDAVPLIFIEEPEAHLHPEAQAILMFLFSRLIKCKVNMIITSHSNYMFNKMNNLILSKEIDINNIQSYLLEQKDYGSEAKSMVLSKLGFNDDNFSIIAEELYNESINNIKSINGNKNDL